MGLQFASIKIPLLIYSRIFRNKPLIFLAASSPKRPKSQSAQVAKTKQMENQLVQGLPLTSDVLNKKFLVFVIAVVIAVLPPRDPMYFYS